VEQKIDELGDLDVVAVTVAVRRVITVLLLGHAISFNATPIRVDVTAAGQRRESVFTRTARKAPREVPPLSFAPMRFAR